MGNCNSFKKKSNSKVKYKHNENNMIEKKFNKISSLIKNPTFDRILTQIRNYNFFQITKWKNDFYIECDLLLQETEEIDNIANHLEKWIQIISLSRSDRKLSYQNLYTEKEQLENKDHLKNSNFLLSNTNNCEIKVYEGKDKYFSDLIVKLQIAYNYNKERFIKYLSKGPPNNLRWAIWLTLAITDSNNKIYNREEYKILTEKIDQHFLLYYNEQLKKDIKRSNMGLEYLDQKHSEECLYRILKALAIIDPELGYCQGMNIITANLLMVSDCNELETFNIMFYLMNVLELREFFLDGFPKLLMFIFIFREFIKEEYPSIHVKLEYLDIPEEIWIFKWLQTLFFLYMPLAVSVRIIDCILCFGLEFLINFSLSFVKENEEKILSCKTLEDFLEIFKKPEFCDEDEEEEEEEENTKDKTNEKMRENSKNQNIQENLNSYQVNGFDDFKNKKTFNNANDKNIKEEHVDEKLKRLNDEINNRLDKQSFKDIRKPETQIKSKFFEYKNFNLTKDVILFREKLVREAKSLCIRDLIEKMIDNYSNNNNNQLLNFNYNNVYNLNIMNENANYLNNEKDNNNIKQNDHQKTVSINDIEYERPIKGLQRSNCSSPRSKFSDSHIRKSIKEELMEYEQEEVNDKIDRLSKDKENIKNETFSENDQNKSNISYYLNYKEDIPQINRQIDNLVKDFKLRKTITYNRDNFNPRAKPLSNVNFYSDEVSDKKSNISNKKINNINESILECNKSVKFEKEIDVDYLNTYQSKISKISKNYDKYSDTFRNKEIKENKYNFNNIYQTEEERRSVYNSIINPRGYIQTEKEVRKITLNKNSGDTNLNSVINSKSKNKLKNPIRNSLTINFGRKLNIDQITKMNRIKNKMSIILSMNESENKKNQILNLNVSKDKILNHPKTTEKTNKIFNTDSHRIIQDKTNIIFNTDNHKILENKKIASDYIQSLERKNTLITKKNQFSKIENYNTYLMNTFVSENLINTEPIQTDLYVNTDEINFKTKSSKKNDYENVNKNYYKKRNASAPFIYNTTLKNTDRIIVPDKNEEETSNINNDNFKNICRNIRDKLNSNGIKNTIFNNSNYNRDNFLSYISNNVIIEEEPGIGNPDD